MVKLQFGKRPTYSQVYRAKRQNRPCPRCGQFCQSAPHFRAGFEPGRRRRAPKCPKR